MRSIWLPALSLLVALSVGCEEEAAAPPPVVAPVPPPDKAKAKAKAAEADTAQAAPVDALASAKKAAWAGDASTALTAFVSQVGSGGSDAWMGVCAAALASGDIGAALTAIENSGDPTSRGLLVAELQIKAGNPAAALAAAQSIEADQPDAAAAMIARAILAGATPPWEGDGDKNDPVASLTRYAQAKDSRIARTFAEKAEAVSGWRAALLRGESKARWGELDGALAEFATVAESGDPAAVLAGNLARAKAGALAKPGKGGPVVSAVDVAAWAATAAKAAIQGSDVAQFQQAMAILVPWGDRALRPNVTADVAKQALAAAGNPSDGLGELRLTYARVALASGDPLTALEQTAALKENASLSAEAAWLSLWASWEMRDAVAISAAADQLSGPRGLTGRAMVEALTGDIAAGLRAFPSSGLTDREFVYITMAGARMAGDGAVDWLTRAVRHADRTNDPSLRIETRLALESAARRVNPSVAARTLGELAKLVPAGDEGNALRSELAARLLLSEGKTSFPEGDLPAVVKAWRSLSENQVVTAEGPGIAGVRLWAEGRAAVAGGQGGSPEQYNEALKALPLHRWGWLSSGTVLDGSQGVPYEDDLALLATREPTDAVLGCALAAHEVGHVLDRAEQDSARGRDLLAGLDEATRKNLLVASAALRSAMIRWQAGAAPFPAEQLKALEAAEEKADADTVFKARVRTSAPPPLQEIRAVNGKLSVLSFTFSRGQVHGLVVTPNGGGMQDLGSSDKVLKAAGDHLSALQAGARTDTRASHTVGDFLRATLLDPFTQTLSGHGWFAVVAPQPLRDFMFTTFPDQAAGLRWLAEIRTMAVLDRLSRINVLSDDQRDPERFRKGPDFLGLMSPSPAPAGGVATPAAPAEVKPEATEEGAPAENAPDEGDAAPKAKAKAKGKAKAKAGEEGDEPPDHICLLQGEATPHLKVAERFFDPDFREVCRGPEAGLKQYFELAPRARYIHIDSVEATKRGGFVLADGDLDLNAVRGVPLVAELVIITAEGTLEQQQARASAFLDAGAQAVMMTTWQVPDGVHERMLDGFWSALKRDRPISRAAAEGRDSLLRDALLGDDLDNPGLWGSVLLYTTP